MNSKHLMYNCIWIFVFRLEYYGVSIVDMNINDLKRILPVTIAIMLIIGFGSGNRACAKDISDSTVENPVEDLSKEAFSPESGKKGLTKLKSKLNKKLSGQKGKWSVYVKNLDTNEYLLINNKKLPSASLIKLFVMLSVYEEVEQKKLSEDSSLKSSIRKMITVSDNEAANELTKMLTKKKTFSAGANKINRFCRDNGYGKTRFLVEMGKCSKRNVTSTKDCGWALERMYRGTAVNKKSSKKMIKLLKAQQRRGKLPAGLPKGVTVANKTGETSFAENDAAIVYSEGADYIIVVMSNNGNGSVEMIRDISGMVYRYFNSVGEIPHL